MFLKTLRYFFPLVQSRPQTAIVGAASSLGSQRRELNGNRAAISRPGRKHYTRMYPTTIVYPDGSTVTARYHIPLSIVKIPVLHKDLEGNPTAQKAWEMRRRPKEKIYSFKDETFVSFDRGHYLNMFRNRRSNSTDNNKNNIITSPDGSIKMESEAPPLPEPVKTEAVSTGTKTKEKKPRKKKTKTTD